MYIKYKWGNDVNRIFFDNLLRDIRSLSPRQANKIYKQIRHKSDLLKKYDESKSYTLTAIGPDGEIIVKRKMTMPDEISIPSVWKKPTEEELRELAKVTIVTNVKDGVYDARNAVTGEIDPKVEML
jgi:hypothetical protein